VKKNLLPLALGGLGIGFTEFVMMGLLPDIATDLNISIPAAGHLISLYALGVVIGAPVLVTIANNYAPKKILMWLMGVFSLFNILSAFAPNYNLLSVARLLCGLPHGAFFGVGAVVASRLADKGKEARAISMMFAGLTFANLVAVPLGTYVGHEFSWRITFALIGLIGIVTMICINYLLPALPNTKSENNKHSELIFFKSYEAWLIILLTTIGTGGLFAWISYIAPMMTEITRFSAGSVPYIMMLAGFGMVVGNFLGGKIGDMLSPAKACGMILVGIALCLLTVRLVANNQVLALIMTFVTGAVTFSLSTPIQLLMIRSAKGAEMLAASVTHAAFNIGNALGAYFGGLVIAAGFGYTAPQLVGVIMALSGVVVVMFLLRRQNSVVASGNL
jgi:MFS transporter, DHA1 family, arabinose polymer utilization protein